MDSQETADLKRALRRDAFAVRDAAWRQDPEAGQTLKRQLAEALAMPPGLALSGYWPLEGEIDVRPALFAYHAEGHTIGLPVVTGKGEPLVFRQWRPEDAMVMGQFKVLTPPEHAADIIPQILLIPMLAFDPEGYRLGYGGGFYDRTLAKLRAQGRALAVGVAYAAQEMPWVPRGSFDQPLDVIVTEHAIFKFNIRR